MRTEKCKKLCEKLDRERLVLVKSPPGSGKTSLSRLVQFYVGRKLEKKVLYLVRQDVKKSGETHEQMADNILSLINQKTKYDDREKKHEWLFIIDEAQAYFSDAFQKLWEYIKTCTERFVGLWFLCLSTYADISASTSRINTPLVFNASNTESLSFLRYDKEEYDELISSYKNASCFPEADMFVIDDETKDLIYETALGHPELTHKIIAFFYSELKNEFDQGIEAALKLIYSSQFKYLLGASRACPTTKEFKRVEEQQKKILIHIVLHNAMKITPDDQLYDDVKKLEWLGFLYEDPGTFTFNFVSRHIAGIVLETLIDSEKEQPIGDLRKLNTK